jgi:hypothetical protein
MWIDHCLHPPSIDRPLGKKEGLMGAIGFTSGYRVGFGAWGDSRENVGKVGGDFSQGNGQNVLSLSPSPHFRAGKRKEKEGDLGATKSDFLPF